jgi:hypothetical protein
MEKIKEENVKPITQRTILRKKKLKEKPRGKTLREKKKYRQKTNRENEKIRLQKLKEIRSRNNGNLKTNNKPRFNFTRKHLKKIPNIIVQLGTPVVQGSSTRKSNAAKLIQEKFRQKLEHNLKKASNVSESRRKNKLRCKEKFYAMKKFIDEKEKNVHNIKLIHKNTPHYVEKAKKYKDTIPVKKYMACMGDSPFTPTFDDKSYFSELKSRSGSRSLSRS